MYKVAVLSLLAMSSISCHPIKNVFASVDESNEGPNASPGIGNFVQASVLHLPEIPVHINE